MGQGPRYPSYDSSYEQSYPSYDDQFAEPVDLDTFGSQLRPQRPARSIATREEFLPDDTVPLFLSGSEEEARSPRFGRPPRKRSSRLLKIGAFALAATIATFVAVKNPFTVFANATASLMGTAEVRPAPATATPPPPPSNPAPTQAAAVAPSAAAPSLAAVAATNPSQAPSRDEIAVALRNAHQSQPVPEPPQPPAAPSAPVAVAAAAPVAVVAPVPVAAPPVIAAPAPTRRLPPDELATLMTRGKALLAAGDIPPARLLLERAAEAGEATAALLLAQTYDPAVLGTQDTRNITPDPAMARNWYQRAAQLGSADAQRRLSQLQ